ncbi:hypothetical protein H4S06_005334 [Coemansia sp. BCRC 34490]|nr:hypothetical protein H4S06_005334 [Coemansia sp. BCRC 34490]
MASSSICVLGNDSNDREIAADAALRASKEITSLPTPSTMGPDVQHRSSWNINNKLVDLLQYLNPLFYARLAQSLVYSMLESFGSNAASGHNIRIESDGTQREVSSLAAVVPADAIAIDCGYIDDTGHKQVEHTAGNNIIAGAQYITVSPEFEYLPDLDLGPSSVGVAKTGAISSADKGNPTHTGKPASVSQTQSKPNPDPMDTSNTLPTSKSADESSTDINRTTTGVSDSAEKPSEDGACEPGDKPKGPKKGNRKKNRKNKERNN